MKVYISSVDALIDSEIHPVIPPYRQKKIDSFLFEKDKKLSLGVELLFQQACRDFQILTPEIVFGSNGKPAVKNCDDFHFNLSHSEEMVMCVADTVPVGCDVEKIQPIDLDIARRFFYRSEYASIAAQPDDESRNFLFYRYWTLKESFMKVTGLGMSLPLDAFEIMIGDDGISVRQNVSDACFEFKEYFRNDGYCYASCRKLSENQ